MTTSSRSREPYLLAALLGGAGVLHIVRPSLFRSMVPAPLPRKHELVLVSGAVEIAAAALLLHPSSRRAGGAVALGLFAGVWPANLQMTVDAVRGPRPRWYVAATIARLPLQIPLLRVSARLARSQAPSGVRVRSRR
ncbi:DoxX family protein [Aeromicrobium sp. CF3.5]|uniref:DoxX family protein n=1 Tax=Aeromicrobium sp. CF3.5 TaxID=3373078 RepID=UPI003EE4E8E5